MPLHVGIIACSSEGAALCYQTICSEAEPLLGRHAHPEVSLHAHSLSQYVDALDCGDWERVGRLMLTSAENVVRAGADFLICPDNTIHQALPFVEARSRRPWIHIADAVAVEARRRNFNRVGVLGTRYLLQGPVYRERLQMRGIECAVPPEPERDDVHQIIMNELVRGIRSPQAHDRLLEIVSGLRAMGCDAVALACTELPLLLNDGSSSLPVLDSTRLLARAALDRAVQADDTSGYLRERSPGDRASRSLE